MSKKIKFLIVIILLIVFLGMHVSSVIAVTNSSFFYTNKQEVSQGDTLEMTLDISKIKYDKFEFKLSSNLDTSNIVINGDVDAENYNNYICIEIDKSKTKLDKITFYYQVPENSQEGTKIELSAEIIVETEKGNEQTTVQNTSQENAQNIANSTTNNTVENSTEKIETESKVVDSKKIEVVIVEKTETKTQEKNNQKSDFNTNSVDKNNTQNNQNSNNTFVQQGQQMPQENKEESTAKLPNTETKNSTGNMEISVSQKSMPSSSGKSMSASVSSASFSSISAQTTETAVYNGSSNNYLSNLEIEGETLNTTFNKENTTYFVKTSGKTELNITATAEESSAKVYINGNDSLKTGDNKILISVTAENGDVRYYRVFITNS